jgi:hypothetical protein
VGNENDGGRERNKKFCFRYDTVPYIKIMIKNFLNAFRSFSQLDVDGSSSSSSSGEFYYYEQKR